jgi:hypothetical protein
MLVILAPPAAQPLRIAPAHRNAADQSVRLYVHWGFYVRCVSSPLNKDIMHMDEVKLVAIRWELSPDAFKLQGRCALQRRVSPACRGARS